MFLPVFVVSQSEMSRMIKLDSHQNLHSIALAVIVMVHVVNFTYKRLWERHDISPLGTDVYSPGTIKLLKQGVACNYLGSGLLALLACIWTKGPLTFSCHTTPHNCLTDRRTLLFFLFRTHCIRSFFLRAPGHICICSGCFLGYYVNIWDTC
jgi:hypothetical protein